eukprot:scaffold31177_cov80-Cyclotella_meneghiniana.AAC.1
MIHQTFAHPPPAPPRLQWRTSAQLTPRQATSRSDTCFNSDVSVADQNNLISRSRNPFAGKGFGRPIGQSGRGFLPRPSRVVSLLLDNTMLNATRDSQNIKEAKTKQQEVGGDQRSRYGKIPIIHTVTRFSTVVVLKSLVWTECCRPKN